MCRGLVGKSCSRLGPMLRVDVLAVEKTVGGLRPLLIGSMCRRLAMTGVARLLRLTSQRHVAQTNVRMVQKKDV